MKIGQHEPNVSSVHFALFTGPSTMNEIKIYQTEQGTVEVWVEQESAWQRQAKMSLLFGRKRSVITKHPRNVFTKGKLEEVNNVQNLHITGSDKPVKFYSLDRIISVGYRVKSFQGTCFRQWATRILREHLPQGFPLNRQRLEANTQALEAAGWGMIDGSYIRREYPVATGTKITAKANPICRSGFYTIQ
ncbi:MAG: virulence RhuM family protein [Desulfobulbaceae bacterium]|nr:virulence RhuM family protein [Desulfobulbaceae bacterium]